MNLTDNIYWRYFILVSRCLLAFIFISYGLAKLTNNQFGINEIEMQTPIKDLSLFKVSWYLFNHQPFKMTIGFFEILAGVLILINRTVVLGILLLLPIIFTILIIDVSFMPKVMAMAFTFRLSWYMVLCLMILYSFKNEMKIVINQIFNEISVKMDFPKWSYILIPFFIIGLELLGILPKTIYILIKNMILR